MTNVEIAAASNIMLGTTEAFKMYIGSTLIWSSPKYQANGLPVGWTQLAYISSTSSGGEYIDLGIKLYETAGTDYDIAVKFNLKGAGKDNTTQATMFSSQDTATDPWPGNFIRKSSNKVRGRYIGGSAKDNDFANIGDIVELPVQTAPSKNVTNLNNSNNVTHQYGTSLFCAFSDTNNTPSRFAEADLYYFKLFVNGVLVRDLIPCEDSNGVVGMYDILNHVFYTTPDGAFVGTSLKTAPTYTAPTAKSVTYNGNSQTLLNAGSTNDGTIEYSEDESTWGTTIPSKTAVGTYTIYWRLTGDAQHLDVPSTSITVTLDKGSINPSVSMSNWTYGNSASSPSVSGNTDSGSVTYSYKGSSESDSSYSSSKPSVPGTYTVRASISSTSNYYGATCTSNFTIYKASGSVSISGVSLSYNGSSRNLVSVSGNTGTMHYSTNMSSWSTSIPTSTDAGSWTIYWYMDSSTYYDGISSSSSRYVTSTISKINPTITATPTDRGATYSGSSQSLLTGGSANVNGTFVYEYGTNVNTYTASWTFYPSDSTNYNTASGTVTAHIYKANQSAPTAYGDITTYNTTATASASGGGGVGSLQWESAQSQTSVGEHTTRARWTGDSNYNASDWSNVVTVKMNRASGYITTAPTARSLTYNGSALSLVNEGSGSGVMYYNLNGGAYSTSVPTATNAGTYTVGYYAAESTNYTQSNSGSVQVTIAKLSRTISWDYSTVPYGMTNITMTVGNTKTLSATVSAGSGDGSISYSSSDTSVGSVSGSTLTAVGTGSSTITATVAEGTNYYSASTSFTLDVNSSSSSSKSIKITNSSGNSITVQGITVELSNGLQHTLQLERTIAAGDIQFVSANGWNIASGVTITGAWLDIKYQSSVTAVSYNMDYFSENNWQINLDYNS